MFFHLGSIDGVLFVVREAQLGLDSVTAVLAKMGKPGFTLPGQFVNRTSSAPGWFPCCHFGVVAYQVGITVKDPVIGRFCRGISGVDGECVFRYGL